MKSHTATLITGAIFVVAGFFITLSMEPAARWFSIGPNLLTGGLFVIVVSLLVKAKA